LYGTDGDNRMIQIKAILFDGIQVKNILINVTEDNYELVKLKLKSENLKIINKIKEYKKAGLIISIFNPKNKKMQSHLEDH
jgi:hypothetical protein